MVYHRIQKKRRNKLKPVDPFNKNRVVIQEAKLKGKNLEPAEDDQPLTRRLLEIKRNSVPSGAALKPARRKRPKNRVFEEAKKGGFEIQKWDDTNRLLRRIGRTTHDEVQEKLMLAKYEIAGCDVRKLEESMINDAKKKSSNPNPSFKRAKINGAEQMNEAFLDDSVNKASSSEQKRKLSKKQRYRIKKKEQQESEAKELLLNAKEYIPFGSHYDAPPQFSGALRRKLEPNFAKAGKKSLLMKNLFKKTDEENRHSSQTGGSTNDGAADSKTKRKNLEAERHRVIEAYRNRKKSQEE